MEENCGEQPNSEQEFGSLNGKFQNEQELLKAYQNLEKEFTKKSQELSSLKKQNDAKNSLNDELFFGEKWASDVEKFLLENPKAKNHAVEISNLLIEDKELKNTKNPLQSAWQIWLTKNFKEQEDYLQDESFLEKVCQNNQVKNRVISCYLSEINKRDNTPPILKNSLVGGNLKSRKTTTLEEAKELAKKIFNK